MVDTFQRTLRENGLKIMSGLDIDIAIDEHV